MDKQSFLNVSEVVDSFRIVPRVLLFAISALVWHVVNWFMALTDPTTQQATFVTIIVGIIPAIIGLYQSTGRKWKE